MELELISNNNQKHFIEKQRASIDQIAEQVCADSAVYLAATGTNTIGFILET